MYVLTRTMAGTRTRGGSSKLQAQRITLHAAMGAIIMASLTSLNPNANRAEAAVYYVSNEGSDANDGTSPERPWGTLGRVNSAALQPGDSVLFRRGDHWRGQLVPHSGGEAGHVIYGAYGAGPKPLLLGSVAMNDPDDWQDEGGNIWATAPGSLRVDVGNFIFDGEKSCGVKVWKEEDLRVQGQYWYDEGKRLVKLYSAGNPAGHYSDIECALRRHIINEGGRSYVIYENLALKYGGAHGIGGGGTHHIIVRDCDLSYIGGGDQHGGDRTVRFGNGIEFWANAHDNLVERCRLWEIYDAALTNQNNAANVKQYNITYRNNVIWNSEYSFEYWNRPESSETHDIYFENNTCVNAGHGWGHAQRPGPSGRHLCFYSSSAPARDIYIRNNIFFEARGNAFLAPQWPEAAVAALRIDNNCWYQASGAMISLKDKPYTMAQFAQYQSEQHKEPNSIVADPLFVDAANRDFHLTERSPCVDAGVDVGLKADYDGTPVPQGPRPDIGAYEFRRR